MHNFGSGITKEIQFPIDNRVIMTEKKSNFIVIGAGLPRTGTSSLRYALMDLLDGPCYHMFTFNRSPKGNLDAFYFEKALDGQMTSKVIIIKLTQIRT